jgi:hypothetical protein
MHASAIADNTLYVFGGKWELVLFSDLWAFDLKASAWRRLLASTAFTRYSHSMSFMPACQSLVIFGGCDENKNVQKSVLAYHIGMPRGTCLYSLRAVSETLYVLTFDLFWFLVAHARHAQITTR